VLRRVQPGGLAWALWLLVLLGVVTTAWLAAGEIEHACRSYVLTIWNLLDAVRLEEAERRLVDGIRLAERHDHLGYLGYLHVELGRLQLARAACDEAVRAAERGLSDLPTSGARRWWCWVGCGCAGVSREATSCCGRPRSSRWSCGSRAGRARRPVCRSEGSAAQYR
jgi:hypothetical protein